MNEKILAIIATILLFIISGLAIYSEMGKTQHTIVIDLKDFEDPFEALPNLLPHGQITSIREMDRSRNEYRITVKTHKEKNRLLEWILSNDKVEHARIE